MGAFFEAARVKVALVGFETDHHALISGELTKTGNTDPGDVKTVKFDTLATCQKACEDAHVTAVCVNLDAFSADAVTGFVGSVRVTAPLIAICLSARAKTLAEFPGYHANWKQKFAHYYKLPIDAAPQDMLENCGRLRDVLVCDQVKGQALGHYDTTPGLYALSRKLGWKEFLYMAIVPLVAAVIGGLLQGGK